MALYSKSMELGAFRRMPVTYPPINYDPPRVPYSESSSAIS